MKKIIFLLLGCAGIMPVSVSAQQKVFNDYHVPDSLPSAVTANEDGSVQYVDTNREGEEKTVIVGPLTEKKMASVEAFGMPYTVDGYQPDKEVVRELVARIQRYHFIVLMGTWCGDSQEQIPRLIKVLRLAGVAEDSVKYYGLDRHKKGMWHLEDSFRVEKVPTIVVMRGEKEVGRMVETPEVSIEKDLLNIIK